MWYELAPQFYDETVLVQIDEDLTCKSIYTPPSGDYLHEPDLSTYDRPGIYKGQDVLVNLELDLKAYYLRLEVEGYSWSSVKETPESLKLRVHLLKELRKTWLSMQETDPPGADAQRILLNSAHEIQRIEQMSL